MCKEQKNAGSYWQKAKTVLVLQQERTSWIISFLMFSYGDSGIGNTSQFMQGLLFLLLFSDGFRGKENHIMQTKRGQARSGGPGARGCSSTIGHNNL